MQGDVNKLTIFSWYFYSFCVVSNNTKLRKWNDVKLDLKILLASNKSDLEVT